MAKKRKKLIIKEGVKKDSSLKKEAITSGDAARAKKKLSELRNKGKSEPKDGKKLNLFLKVLKPLTNKIKSSHSLIK